jgi:hypothetical protein
MSSFDELLFGTKSKKQRKKEVLEENVHKGRAAEEQFVWQQRMMGNEVERTGRGSDFRVRERNPLTGRVEKTYLREIKSSDTAPTSPLQRKKRTKKVVVEPLFY